MTAALPRDWGDGGRGGRQVAIKIWIWEILGLQSHWEDLAEGLAETKGAIDRNFRLLHLKDAVRLPWAPRFGYNFG